ncbi:hypothetical protein MCAP1_001304 [Malassezia caprae]|uniref:Deacetylase sirtuin-type domain-containing protein n=1 Tax=Malassezia caprae TaxID=1381934 RepID=A0AAF0E5U2_9BASI|nr:hypothetical protein MCAP1_001304 [Malassezia caprae]
MLVVRLPASVAVEPPPLADAAPVPQVTRRTFTRSSTVGSEKRRASPPVPSLGHGKLAYEVPAQGALPAYAVESDNRERDLGRLYKSLWEARRIAVVCGAGVSVSPPANIPDFRSATGLFARLKERFPHAGLTSGKDLFDARLFQSESSTALFYAMMAELKDMADAAQPTLFHHWLKRLDMEGRLQRVYTQNIDGLEEKAGLTLGVGSGEALVSGSKRKRTGRAWQRSQSDSAVLSASHEAPAPQPLFPRAIPLHGNLSSLSCMLCSHTQTLDAARDVRARDALETLRRGDPVWCERCETADELRTSAGLRSRGIGRMKINVVLYHGENDTAEHVGACVERDLLGLRDPQEPDVPETPAESRARERRMRAAPMPVVEESKDDVGDLSMSAGDVPADNALASAFEEDVKPAREVPAPPAEPAKPRRRKPMPPDLLVVAGTSLKVPGTKRIVREFAKACRARDTGKAHAPVRVVYMNYDFPSAASEWAGVFDMWVQGDVQRTALGLCAPWPHRPLADPAMETLIAQHTWQALAASDTKRKPRADGTLRLKSGKLSTAPRTAGKPARRARALA